MYIYIYIHTHLCIIIIIIIMTVADRRDRAHEHPQLVEGAHGADEAHGLEEPAQGNINNTNT